MRLREAAVGVALAPTRESADPRRARAAADLYHDARVLSEEVLLRLGVDVDAMPGGCVVPPGRRGGPPSYPPSD